MGKIFGGEMFDITKVTEHSQKGTEGPLVNAPYEERNESAKVPFAFGNGKNDGKGGTATDPA